GAVAAPGFQRILQRRSLRGAAVEVQGDVIAGRVQGRGDGGADAARGAGDEGDGAGRAHGATLAFSRPSNPSGRSRSRSDACRRTMATPSAGDQACKPICPSPTKPPAPTAAR